MQENYINIQSYYKAASQRLPKDVFAFIDGGSHDEYALRRNRHAYSEISILPRVLRGISAVNTECRVLGHALDLPVLIAPAAYQKLLSDEGELDMLNATNESKTLMIVSMFSSIDYSILAKVQQSNVWMQMYFLKDRQINLNFIKMAEELNFKGLVVTVDAPVYARREREIATPLNLPKTISFSHLQDIGIPFDVYLKSKTHLSSILDPKISWDDIAWLSDNTRLPIILKGLLHHEDSQIALSYPNVCGIVLSNHGGRQLDAAVSPLEVLREHKNIVGNQIPLFIDGGITRGSDIFKALAMGANAVLIGRSALWPLAVAGKQGVINALSILKQELSEVMTLCGCASISDISENYITYGRSK